jgi:hypothetical protein
MPVQRRAYVIGLLGLAIQAIGLTWAALHVAIVHWSLPLSARHLMYEPPILLVIVGFLASLVCVPVAIEVAQAREEDVEIPVYEPDPQQRPAPVQGYSRPGRRHAG